METALETLSRNELLKLAKEQLAAERAYLHQAKKKQSEIDRLTLERDYLKAQLEMFQRMQYGQKRERFEGDPN